mmetsp:Transcript_34457/g.73395  ORF Transcript_34457/g.73395 Transcript_34457/m.73395 type:complete len:498 (-) Transcript_34457:29-1522(-)
MMLAGETQASPKGSRSRLQFTVKCSITKPGQAVALVGAGPTLSNWGESGNPIVFSCLGDGENSVLWPQWSSSSIELSEHQVLEYKYVLVDELTQSIVRWETREEGDNRQRTITSEDIVLGKIDDGDFGRTDRKIARDQEKQEERAKRAQEKEKMLRENPDLASESKDRSHNEKKTEKNEKEKKEKRDKGQIEEEEDTDPIPSHKKLQKIGKGKQGKCYLVEMEDGTRALLKELQGGGRHAFKAEVKSLQRLRDTKAALAGNIPRFLGAGYKSRQVLMSYFPGSALPDSSLAPSLRRATPVVAASLRCWLDIANAVGEANELDVIHCDVNPWNLLVTDDYTSCCLVDWACAQHPSESAKGLPFKKRGDFQAQDLVDCHVGAYTDAFGAASTLLWLLARRTRKGLAEELQAGPESLANYFRSLRAELKHDEGESKNGQKEVEEEEEAGGRDPLPPEFLTTVASAVVQGMSEQRSERSSLKDLRAIVQRALAVLEPSKAG